MMRSQPNYFEVVLIGHIGDGRSPEPEDWVQQNTAFHEDDLYWKKTFDGR